ncbi:MAG: DUF2878 domain-containing protein [Planctomycetota bacterium]
MKPLLINVIGFYAAWFACVLGAAYDYYLIGPLAVFVVMLVHLTLHGSPKPELMLAGLCFAAGFVVDSALVATGIMTLKPDFMPQGVTTFWMMCMWVNFGLTLNVSLKILRRHRWIAVFLGLTGGPAAYYTGQQLGALTLPDPLWMPLAVIGLAWGAATPFLVWAAQWLQSRFRNDPMPSAFPLEGGAR